MMIDDYSFHRYKDLGNPQGISPIPSMYGMFTYIYHKIQLNLQ